MDPTVFSDQNGSMGHRRITALALSMGLLLGACVDSIPRGDPGGDPTNWLGATAWVVEARVTSQDDASRQRRHIDFVVLDVLYQAPTYFWSGEVATPTLVRGETVLAVIPQPSTEVDLVGETVYIALQAAGDPSELEAMVRSTDGERPYVATLIVGSDWNLIEAAGEHFDVYREVLALYGKGREALLSLIADASVPLRASNRAALRESEMSEEELEQSSPIPVPTTRGPLGEWRRANGYEGEVQAAVSLEEWLAVPAEERQLFMIEEEVIPGSAAALGFEGWIERELVVVNPSELTVRYPWIGVRVPGVGVLGPFSLSSEVETSISGLLPAGLPIELVGWTESLDPDLEAAEVIGVLPETLWASGDTAWVEVIGSAEEGFELRLTDDG
jgi:hypothetical protein